MNRRDFLKMAGAGAGLLALTVRAWLNCWAVSAHASAEPCKPNIVFLLADDLARRAPAMKALIAGCKECHVKYRD